ncbi:DUF3810 domain-containing protein [Desulfitibacter alkalitolerans]|uniref:DUF3810 domain-containing protein n=1 Tax=Desulfitibacter alkalitolerans TaxID=264641 RepID=UPI0004874B0A|nr:DUF3810 domain-containing protein [Desulfitibacter alkalitolerans]
MKVAQIRLLIYVFLFCGTILSLFAPQFPKVIEALYSTGIYYWLVRPYSLLTGLIPFSLAELVVVALAMYIVYKLVKVFIVLFRQPRIFIKAVPGRFIRIGLVLFAVYLAFNLIWGLNYSRATFADISGLPVESASVDELAELALHLTHRANELRAKVDEDQQGVMILSNGIKDMLNRAHIGYERAGEIYPELAGRYGRPKGVMLSPYWSYTGIGGVFFPFTAEANVNIHMPHFMLPSTTTHEMAHQRGFAREDEANYIAYLTCILHPDPDFQYSGVVLALTYVMRELRKSDSEAWKEIRLKYSEGVNRDFEDWKNYWARYEGPVDQISTNINNTYLMANRQTDGVNSYGRMVDLMLAEFRAASSN